MNDEDFDPVFVLRSSLGRLSLVFALDRSWTSRKNEAHLLFF